jgi:hypothetical protein
MARLAKFILPDGSSIVAEVDDDSLAPPVVHEPGRVMRGGIFTPESAPAPAATTEIVVKANATFETALDRIRSASESMLNRLTSLAQPPDELAIEFGVKLNAETGAVIAKAATEANFTIHMKWTRAKANGASGAKE